MFRATVFTNNIINGRVSNQVVSNENLGINGVFSQIIRWKRKPIWLPPAKSKLFKVPPRLRLPEEEAGEILRLYNHYRTYRKSIREYLIQLVNVNQVQFDEELLKNAEEQDYAHCWNVNEEWNRAVTKIRAIRAQKEYDKRKEQVIKSIDEKIERDMKLMEVIEQKVKKATVEAQTFITRQNIDQAIEEALISVVNYNTAIDREGIPYDRKYNATKKEATNQH